MIILDFETNSNNPKDVLEVCAYKIAKDNKSYKIIDTFHRYYYSKYDINFFALEVHQLSPEKIRKLRKGVRYSKYFEDDDIAFKNFCKEAKTLIAHNVSFELRYLDNIVSFKNHFCTMKENKDIVNVLNIKGHKKNPKLIETCLHYGIEFDECKYHNAKYDALKVLEILNAMNNEKNNFDIIQYTIETNKQKIIDEKERKKAKEEAKKLKKIKPSKRQIEREKWLKYIVLQKTSIKKVKDKEKHLEYKDINVWIVKKFFKKK